MIDSHCHIHDSEYFATDLERQQVYERSVEAGVEVMMCIGTSEKSSREAIDMATKYQRCYATVGVHPHEARHGCDGIEELIRQNKDAVYGIGEIGLDYYYENSVKSDQIQVLRKQLRYAVQYDLPVSFHVREAFDDFWPVFDEFTGVRGVLHSYTDTLENLHEGLERGLYIGVNGIATFTKDSEQQKMFAAIPLGSLLLETDAPFLTPKPFRGKMNEPSMIRHVAQHLEHQYGCSVEDVLSTTAYNTKALFRI